MEPSSLLKLSLLLLIVATINVLVLSAWSRFLGSVDKYVAKIKPSSSFAFRLIRLLVAALFFSSRRRSSSEEEPDPYNVYITQLHGYIFCEEAAGEAAFRCNAEYANVSDDHDDGGFDACSDMKSGVAHDRVDMEMHEGQEVRGVYNAFFKGRAQFYRKDHNELQKGLEKFIAKTVRRWITKKRMSNLTP